MILDQIVADNLRELKDKKAIVPLAELQRAASEQPTPLDFTSALRGDAIKLIAEVKKASPSKGIICPNFDPITIAQTYADNGAAAISVLTEVQHFQGNLNHLRDIKKVLRDKRLPLLRKDFIYDSYQVYESRVYGADGLLLIVAILTADKLDELLRLSHKLGMSCLIEVHNEAELEIALNSGAKIIGINNRDLTTFNVDLTTTEQLRPLIPQDRIVVSESGIKNHGDMEKMRQWNIDAVLIGKSLLSAPDIVAKMKELL